MKLPVVTAAADPSWQTLWRRYVDIALDHASVAGDVTAFAGASGVIGDNAVGRRGNCVFVSADESGTVDVPTVMAAYGPDEARPVWITAADTPGTDRALADAGYRARPWQLLRLRAASVSPADRPGVLVLPGRSARAAHAAWCDGRSRTDPLAVLLPRHLDDPQYEAFVALRGGRAIGTVGVQTRGQTGLVCDLFVEPAERRKGLATLLLGRAIESAARGQLLDVFAARPESDPNAANVLERAGFKAVGQFAEWST